MAKINELRSEVRELKEAVRYRERAYKLTGIRDPLYEKELAYLKGITRGRQSTKKDLELYKQEAEFFLDWDISSPVGLKQASKREHKAYTSFKKNTGINLSYQDWRHLVTMMGTLGSDVLEKFGYGEGKSATGALAETFQGAKKQGREADFLHAMLDTMRESKGAGMTQSELISSLNRRLGVVAEENEQPKKRGRKKR